MRFAQRGSMLIFGIGILLTLTSFAVLAVDIGRIFIVRNELQNVADAAALAGANCLARESDPTSPVDCVETMATALNWDRAIAKAQDHLSHNSAAGTPISSTDAGHEIQVGYWNILEHQPSGGTYSRTFTPLTVNDKPAVRVYVRKDAGVNDGPVAMLTRLMFGRGSDTPMWAESVAVISSPSSVAPNSLLPVVINDCMFSTYWDSANGTPRLYNGPGSVPADPYNLSNIGEPYTIRIGSSYHYGACEQAGQWTTFDQFSPSARTVRDLVENGNPSSLEIDDQTYIKPGTAATDFQAVRDTYLGQDVTVVVVSAPNNDLSIQGSVPVVAFAGFHIDAVATNGRDPAGDPGFYIQGHFIPGNVTTGGSGIGPFFGTYQPPRLGR
ncbi:MAG TPA: pilus assembly protein TadG-related protein [Ramlibacter sp.]